MQSTTNNSNEKDKRNNEQPAVNGAKKSETGEESKTSQVKKPKAVTADKDFKPGQSGTVK